MVRVPRSIIFLMYSSFFSVGIWVFQFCQPSRGADSRMITFFGSAILFPP